MLLLLTGRAPTCSSHCTINPDLRLITSIAAAVVYVDAETFAELDALASDPTFVPSGAAARSASAPCSSSVYFRLLLVDDRNGVSFYAYEQTCGTLELTADD